MTEQVRDYVSRAMIGRRVEIAVWSDDKVRLSAYGRLASVVHLNEHTDVYFVGDKAQPSIRFDDECTYTILWDPEERD